MKVNLSTEKIKPNGSTKFATVPILNLPNTVNPFVLPPDTPRRRTDDFRRTNFHNWNSYNYLVIVLLIVTAVCSWMAVYLILKLSVSQWQALDRIEERLSAIEPAKEIIPGHNTVATSSEFSWPTTDTDTVGMDTTVTSTATTAFSSSTETVPTPICKEPLFQDLKPDPIKGTTKGYEYEPLEVKFNNWSTHKRNKTYKCRRACSKPEYYQFQLFYQYNQFKNDTVEFEGFGFTKEDAKLSVIYEALKCYFPNKTVTENIAASEDWFTPDNKPDCEKDDNANYSEC